MNTLIIDFGMGNLRSIQKKIERLGGNPIVSNDLSQIEKADKLILPGVGQFGAAIRHLKISNILDVLHHKVIDRQTPILGICLGMQLMAKRSDEGDETGLGWFDAEVVKFNIANKLKYKVPHIGWNNVVAKKDNFLLNGIVEDKKFYFVHSYHIKCNHTEDILTETEYEYVFTSSICRDNIYGVQFHPEKSHEQGKVLLKNFLNL